MEGRRKEAINKEQRDTCLEMWVLLHIPLDSYLIFWPGSTLPLKQRRFQYVHSFNKHVLSTYHL